MRKVTSAPVRRSFSARSALSLRKDSSASGERPLVKGEYQTSSPASAAWRAAVSSRSGSPPVTRTASQRSSSRMTRISRRTAAGSNGSWVVVPAEAKPVS
ncbi:hypothetical protein [Streptomyces griseolus]|uniref:hypothetical protein n=1 Tax=Streptomyces griseolus TaxID=1909 RepID=UPI002ADD7D77|nr:hypothetical protein [Streptomyces griseolus]